MRSYAAADALEPGRPAQASRSAVSERWLICDRTELEPRVVHGRLRVWGGHIGGHCVRLRFRPFFLALEGTLEGEDSVGALARDCAPRGERAAVAHAIDFVAHRLRGRSERLGNHQPAVDAAPGVMRARRQMGVRTMWIQGEYVRAIERGP